MSNNHNNLCPICGKPLTENNNFEGIIHASCKAEIDQKGVGGDLKAYEEDMLSYNHHGETCWLRGGPCQEGWCSECWPYLKWKESQKGVKAR